MAINELSFLFLSGFALELLVLIIFQKVGNGLRIREFWYHLFTGRNLSPILKTGTIITGLVVLYLIYNFGWPRLQSYLLGTVEPFSQAQQSSFLIFSIALFVFFTAKFILNRNFNHKWVWGPLVVAIIAFVITFYV